MVKVALSTRGITTVLELVAARYHSLEGVLRLIQHNPVTARISKLKLFDLVQGREVDHKPVVWLCRLLGIDPAKLLATGAKLRSKRTVALESIPPAHRQLVERALAMATPEQKERLAKESLAALEKNSYPKYIPTTADAAQRQRAFSSLRHTCFDATGLVIAALPLLPFGRQQDLYKAITGYRLSRRLEYTFEALIRPTAETYAWLDNHIEAAFGSRYKYVAYLSDTHAAGALSFRTANRVVYDLRLKNQERLQEFTYFSWSTFARYVAPLPLTLVEVCLHGVETKLQGEASYRLSSTKYFLEQMANFSSLEESLRAAILVECLRALNRQLTI